MNITQITQNHYPDCNDTPGQWPWPWPICNGEQVKPPPPKPITYPDDVAEAPL